MKSTKKVEKLIKNAAIHSRPEVNQSVLNDLLKELPEAGEQKSASAWSHIRRKIMKSSITKLAAAAAIIFAVALLITVVDKRQAGDTSLCHYANRRSIQKRSLHAYCTA
jgi:hypothetical protein